MINNTEEPIDNTWTYVEEEDYIESEQKHHKRYSQQSIKRNPITDIFKEKKTYSTVRSELNEITEKFHNITENSMLKSETMKLIKQNQEERPTEEEGTIITTNNMSRNTNVNSIYDTDGELISISNHEDNDPYLIFFKLIHMSCNIETCNTFFKEYRKLSSAIQVFNEKISTIFFQDDKIDDIKYYVNGIKESFNTFINSIYEIDEIKNNTESNNVLQTTIMSLIMICMSELDYETNDKEKQDIMLKYDNITESHSCYVFKEYLFENKYYYTLIQNMWMVRDKKMEEYVKLSTNLKTIDCIDSETRDMYIEEMINDNSNTYNRLTGVKNMLSIENQSLASIVDEELESKLINDNNETEDNYYHKFISKSKDAIQTAVVVIGTSLAVKCVTDIFKKTDAKTLLSDTKNILNGLQTVVS